jgi:hypothetical protein
MKVALAIVLLQLSCGGTNDPDPAESELALTVEQECARVRDHFVEIKLDDLPPAAMADRAAHVAAMRSALGEDFVSRCTTLSESARDCVLAAVDRESVAACR